VIELETIELVLQRGDLLAICNHLGFVAEWTEIQMPPATIDQEY